MNASALYLAEKEIRFAKYLDFHNIRATHHNWSIIQKLYCFPLPEEFETLQYNHFLIDGEMYVEDHGTFHVILSYLKKRSAGSLLQADFIVVPFNFQFYNKTDKALIDEMVHSIRRQAKGKRLVMFSLGDFCLKTSRRSTIFERRLFQENGQWFVPACVEESDVFITFESTFDFAYTDIPVFPLIALDPVDPFAVEKNYRFSFAGEYYKEGWPEGFVRSSSRKSDWLTIQSTAADALIVTSADLPSKSTETNPFYTIPQQSLYTLCPRGIACWTFRLFEALLCGSIPVILSDSYIRPFSGSIPWDQFSILFPEKNLADVGEFLENIKPAVTDSLRRNLQKNQHWFTANGLLRLLTKELEQKIAQHSPA